MFVTISLACFYKSLKKNSLLEISGQNINAKSKIRNKLYSHHVLESLRDQSFGLVWGGGGEPSRSGIFKRPIIWPRLGGGGEPSRSGIFKRPIIWPSFGGEGGSHHVLESLRDQSFGLVWGGGGEPSRSGIFKRPIIWPRLGGRGGAITFWNL